MSLSELIMFCDELENKFLDLDKKFSIFEDYDNIYAIWASNMGQIQEELYRLRDLEK